MKLLVLLLTFSMTLANAHENKEIELFLDEVVGDLVTENPMIVPISTLKEHWENQKNISDYNGYQQYKAEVNALIDSTLNWYSVRKDAAKLLSKTITKEEATEMRLLLESSDDAGNIDMLNAAYSVIDTVIDQHINNFEVQHSEITKRFRENALKFVE